MLRRLPRDWDDRARYVMQRDGCRCHMCGEPADAVDRVVPSAGYRFANLAPICGECRLRRVTAEAAAQLRRVAG